MLTSLTGYRTYILAGAALLTIAANLFGLVGADTANVLLSVFGFGSLISLRAAVK